MPVVAAPRARAATTPLAEHRDELARRFALSPQEREVLGYVLAGNTTAQMADALFISPSTVRVHLSAVYKKAGVHSREELTSLAQLEDCPSVTPPLFGASA